MTSFLSIGEMMVELADHGGGIFHQSYAGDTFNVAHYLNVVSQGQITADYLTAVGQDSYSQQGLQFLDQHEVSTTRVYQDPDHTIGLFLLGNDDQGEKRYGYWRGQSAARHLFDQPQDLRGYDYIYLSGITGAITLKRDILLSCLKDAKEAGAKLVYDFNHRPKLWSPAEAKDFARALLPSVDIVKISDEEQAVLYGDQDTTLVTQLAPNAEWVRTCEGARAEIWHKGQCSLAKQFDRVETVVDSSAAGDSFIATYLHAKLQSLPTETSLARAHAVASQVIQAKGSIVPIDLTLLEK